MDAEGFMGDDREAIAVVINGEQAFAEDSLGDGDRVELLVNLQGGSDR